MRVEEVKSNDRETKEAFMEKLTMCFVPPLPFVVIILFTFMIALAKVQRKRD